MSSSLLVLSSSKLLVLMIYTSCVSTCLDVNDAKGEALFPCRKLVLLFGVDAILNFEFFNTDETCGHVWRLLFDDSSEENTKMSPQCRSVILCFDSNKR